MCDQSFTPSHKSFIMVSVSCISATLNAAIPTAEIVLATGNPQA